MQYEPFSQLEKFFQAFEKGSKDLGWVLASDVYETDTHLVVRFALPGIDTKKLNITVEGDVLRISGTTALDKEDSNNNYYIREIRQGNFQKAIQLPKKVKSETASAEYKHGILTISLEKDEAKKINVKVTTD